METQLELVEKKRESGDRNAGKKRFHSGKRFSTGAVRFPDWWITNGQSRTTQLVVSYKEGKKISKLREPRNLYALKNQHHYSNINIPRWPVEMKVLSEYPHHLEYLPPDPEVFHNSELITDDSDNFPNLTKIEDGKLVYENSSGHTKYFDQSQIGGNVIKADSSHKLTDTLHFESRFESGNLYKAVKVGPCDYQLWLRTDLYTNKYTQWYYFRVENTQAEKVYRFTIMNLMKSSSLYSSGMKPLMYSEQEAKKNGIGWKRVGMNIKFYKNELKREDVKGEQYLYSLSWSVVFPHAGDRCYFAHCYPYTYTDLQEYLRKMSKDPARSHYCKQKLLTRTLAGNFVYIITITSPSKCPADAKNKRAVVVSARVHPGETNSSWMMKGLLDYLTSDKPDAKLLRDTFVFKIIPMLNPDGVIVGNYRCSLSGRDLNRNYKTALKDSFPSVWHTREMIRRLSEEREVTLYCDLHGHSRQQNVFIYGCEDRRNLTNGFKERVFPMMMSKNCEDKFCFNRCKFKVQKNKSGTGRVVMWNLGIKNSYTLEATFCGSTLGSKSGHHFTTADFESMGYHLCDTLLDYCDPDISKYLSVLNQLEFYVKSLVLERMKEKGVAQPDINLSDIDLDRDYTSESSTSGSDSSVSDGLPMHILYLQPENATKKKRLKTRKERNRRRARTLVKQVKEKQKQKEDKRQDRPPSTDNDLSSERKKKNCVALSRPKTPQRSQLQVAKPTSRHMNDVKIRHDLDSMPNSYGQNRMPVSSDGLTIPRLQYTALRKCFGLAPATPSRSLNRWSARRYNASDGVTDEEDSSNFIGRYMARQMRRSSPARGNDIGSKNDQSELQRKLQVYNESYNMLATVQSYNCDKNDENDRDGKKRNDNKGSMEKYCPHHAAMLLRKANEKKKEGGDEATFQYLSFSPSPSVVQRSSSQSKVSCRNVRQHPMSSKTLVSGVKVSEGNGGDETGLSCAPGRRKSESNFPPLQSAARTSFNNERKTFNFSGVTQQPKNSTGHHSLASENNLGDNDQLSFLVNDENTADVSLIKKAEVPNPVRTASSSPSENFTTQLREETHNTEKRPSECYSPDIKTCEHSPVFAFDVSSTEEGVAKTEEINPNSKEEPSLKTVERLRQKLQNLNTAGRMVTFALNNQLDEVEESIHKSLLNEYINYQQERNVRCSRTFSKIKTPLEKNNAKTTNGEEQRPKKCGEVTKKQETKIAKESGTTLE